MGTGAALLGGVIADQPQRGYGQKSSYYQSQKPYPSYQQAYPQPGYGQRFGW